MSAGQYYFILDEVTFPVAPSKITFKINGQNKTVKLIDGGELNNIKKPGLTDISFDIILPAAEYPFAVYEDSYQPPDFYLAMLKELITEGKVTQFIITRERENLFSQNFTVTLENYDIKDDTDDGYDIKVSIDLKEYKEKNAKKLTVVEEKATVTETRSTADKKAEKTHTVVKGDTLWNISKKYLGSNIRYTEIYNINKDVIESAAKKQGKPSSSNGHWIFPGTVLQIPA